MGFIALIDADSLLYKVGFAIEEKTVLNEWEVEWGDEDGNAVEPVVEYTTDIEQCYSNFDQMVDNMLYTIDCDEALLVFSGKDNFRLDLPTPYKGNRDGNRKPTGYDEILQFALETYNSIVVDGYEADDYVVWAKTKYPDKYTVCAIDKDVIYQTVGTHYNYGKDEFIETDAEYALWYAYLQTLAGDATDGYKGVPGIGDVKARKILEPCKTEIEMWEATVEAYEAKGLGAEDAILTMQLANMHQLHDGEIVLWQPPVRPTSKEQTL